MIVEILLNIKVYFMFLRNRIIDSYLCENFLLVDEWCMMSSCLNSEFIFGNDSVLVVYDDWEDN